MKLTEEKFNWIVFLWVLLFFSVAIHIVISLYDSPGFWTDGYIYLLQADYFLNRYTEYFSVLDQAMEYRNFPPLYPYYLSILNAGSEHIVLASVATSILLLPISLFYIDWQVKEGLDKTNALINGILFLLLPSTILFSTELWSENLYLLLVILTLWSFKKSENSSSKWIYISAVTCGLAFITRSAGLSLVVALLIVVYQRDKIKCIPVAVIISAPWLMWALISNGINYNETYLEHGFIQRYESFVDAYGGYWSGNFTILQFQMKTFWLGMQLQFNTILNYNTAILAGLIAVTASLSIYKRFINLSLDALYIIFYLGIIFVWNFSEHNVRFLYVIMPLLLFYTHETIIALFKNINEKLNVSIRFFMPLLIIITILPCLIFMSWRLYSVPGEHVPYYSSDRQWLTGVDKEKMYENLIFKKKLIEAAIKIKEIVLPEECVYSMHPEFVMLYSKRKTVVPPSQNVSEEEFNKGMRQCSYLFIVGLSYNKHDALYPVDRVKDNSWIIQQSFYPPEYGGGIISVLLELD